MKQAAIKAIACEVFVYLGTREIEQLIEAIESAPNILAQELEKLLEFKW